MGAAAGQDLLFVGPDADPDRYQLRRAVAAGGEGEVWRASLLVDGRVELEVAVKVLHANRADEIGGWRTRWEHQVELVRSLSFPGVATVREAFEGPVAHARGQADPRAGRALCLVMNWHSGVPLHQWMREVGGQDPVPRLQVLVRVAAALDFMHSGHATGGIAVTHGDVKPANILIDSGEATLVDFGLVRPLVSVVHPPGLGSVGYMAPEVLLSGEYGPAADRYAFGCVAAVMLTGQEPPAGGPVALARRLAEVPGLAHDPWLTAHLQAMLNPVPSGRPTGLAIWLATLIDGFRSTEFDPSTSTPVATAPLPPPAPLAAPQGAGRRLPLVLIGTAVAVLVIGGLLFGLSRRGDNQAAAPPASTTSSTTPPSTKPRSTTTASAEASTTVTNAPAATPLVLDTLKPVATDGTPEVSAGLIHSGGRDYPQSVLFGSHGTADFEVPSTARRFTATLGVEVYRDSNCQQLFELFQDGRRLLERTVDETATVPIAVDLDHPRVLTLSVKELSACYGTGTLYGWGDAEVS